MMIFTRFLAAQTNFVLGIKMAHNAKSSVLYVNQNPDARVRRRASLGQNQRGMGADSKLNCASSN